MLLTSLYFHSLLNGACKVRFPVLLYNQPLKISHVHLCPLSVTSPQLRHWARVISAALSLPGMAQREAPVIALCSCSNLPLPWLPQVLLSFLSAHSTPSAVVIQSINKCLYLGQPHSYHRVEAEAVRGAWGSEICLFLCLL